MAIWQGRSKRKASGGRYHKFRDKKAYEMGSDPVYARVGTKVVKRTTKHRAGVERTTIQLATHANLNLGNNKFKQSKIKTARQNAANRHFVRMNVINKGAILETEDGLVRVTSKPTRDGIINAVLVKSK